MASRHMMGNLNFLSKVKTIESIPIELHDGVFRVANLQGTMSLGSKTQLSKFYVFQISIVI